MRYVEQLLDASQTRAIANVILYASDELMSGPTGIVQILDALDEYIDRHGLDDLAPFGRDGEHPGNMACPRHPVLSEL